MPNILLVMIGGAAGAGLRYQIGRWIAALPVAVIGPLATFPLATFAVNIAGGFAMGLLAGVFAPTGSGSVTGSMTGGVTAGVTGFDAQHWQLLIGVGLLGGFTTFSAYSLEIVTLLQSGRSAAAVGYAMASVIGAVAALSLGMVLARSL